VFFSLGVVCFFLYVILKKTNIKGNKKKNKKKKKEEGRPKLEEKKIREKCKKNHTKL